MISCVAKCFYKWTKKQKTSGNRLINVSKWFNFNNHKSSISLNSLTENKHQCKQLSVEIMLLTDQRGQNRVTCYPEPNNTATVNYINNNYETAFYKKAKK